MQNQEDISIEAALRMELATVTRDRDFLGCIVGRVMTSPTPVTLNARETAWLSKIIQYPDPQDIAAPEPVEVPREVVEALEFYGRKVNHRRRSRGPKFDREGFFKMSRVREDDGEKARTALATLNQVEEKKP